MARLCIDLPPFSPDYSGVASAFFSLDALTVLHDAAGCTGNYCGYDEPRWFGSEKAVMCSALREIDAVMGDDEKLVRKVLQAVEALRPGMIALLSSPVPMVIGCDVKGIAHELEERTGLPSFGFDTTGTRYYDWGLSLAFRELYRRFGRKIGKKSGVNILGADYIDFPSGPGEIIEFLEANGYKVNAVLPARTLEDIERLSGAALSLVVSLSGLEMAEELEREDGIPFILGLPVGDGERLLGRMKGIEPGKKKEQPVLVVGESVASWSIADEIGGSSASLFSDDRRLGGVWLGSEKAIRDYLNLDKWEAVIADPELLKLCPGKKLIPNPHYAISSKLNEGAPRFDLHKLSR